MSIRWLGVNRVAKSLLKDFVEKIVFKLIQENIIFFKR
jgi:hypothetical protein